MSRTAICSVCGEFLVDSYGEEKAHELLRNEEGAKND